MTEIQKKLFALQDLKFKEFHSRLIPDINTEVIIGVKVGKVRGLIKELGAEEIEKFLTELPHKYYEE